MRAINVLCILLSAVVLVVASEGIETANKDKGTMHLPNEERYMYGRANGIDTSYTETWSNFKTWFKRKFFFWRKYDTPQRSSKLSQSPHQHKEDIVNKINANN
ncbi:hypothetical protein F441_10602 [Phytophthora nicotianae CJ01A1]|uniref:RxLR effector protein n=3 Tax=Phytophthora nicotianae TaxID=4792 RepID=V9FBS3_PHYNI|nr:hypothetical protein F443_07719 [Phytophthora nicotianae P1569]ETL41561.1 hypothetical protein L916_07504 [Phytophthora nicotianae]ETP14484.1 hypothetical protein F441_10602 [Phytophthora nicotianae CJ01A1]